MTTLRSTPSIPASRGRVVARFALVAALGCGAERSVRPTMDDFAIRVTEPRLEMANRSRESLYVFVIPRAALAYTTWLPCVDSARCPGIAPGASELRAWASMGPPASDGVYSLFVYRAVPGEATAAKAEAVGRLEFTR